MKMRMAKLLTTTTLALSVLGASWLTPVPSAQAQEAVQAGVSAAVRGDVQLARLNAVGRQVNSGDAIFLNDAITSGTDSGMQVLLLDETVFTIGPESELTIDTFVFDPASGQGSLAANMTKGVMRFVTGTISSGQPENMTIKLPVGTIGIRGTIGLVSVLTPEQANQQFPDQSSQLGGNANQPVVFAALVGPGPLSQTGATTGSFNFSSPDGSVDLNRPGGAVLATPGQPPVFFIAPPGALQATTSALSARGSGNNAGDDANAEGGQEAQNGQSGNGAGNGTGDGQAQGSGDGAGDGQAQGSGTGAGGGESQALNASGAGNDVAFSGVGQVMTNTQSASQASQTSSDVASASGNVVTFGDIIAAHSGASNIGASNVPVTGTITGTFNTNISFSTREFDIQFSNLQGGGLATSSFGIADDGVVLSDGASGVNIGGSGVAAEETNCASCTAVVTFTSTNSLSATISHNGNTGSGSTNLN